MAVSDKPDYCIYLYRVSCRWPINRQCKTQNHSDLAGICNDIQELLLFIVITQQQKASKMKHPSNKILILHHHTVDKERNHQWRTRLNSKSVLLVRKTYSNISKNSSFQLWMYKLPTQKKNRWRTRKIKEIAHWCIIHTRKSLFSRRNQNSTTREGNWVDIADKYCWERWKQIWKQTC